MPRLGRLLPLLIAGLLVVDIGARFLPIDRLCFQAWECMTRYQEPGAIFQANRRFESERTHGNLSNMGNLPALRQIRPQVFTTDANGFRNPPGADRVRPDVVVVGDSFVVGYGVTDADTFPVQLSALTGGRIYNAGGPYAYLQTVRLLRERLGFSSGRVIIVWTESEPVEQLRAASAAADGKDRREQWLATVIGGQADRVRSLLRGWWYTSPLKIVSEKAFLTLANDRVLPNIYKDRVVERHLRTGETMLFYPSDVDGFHSHREIAPARDFIVPLVAELRKEGYEPVLVLAPSKYTVYYPLLADEPRSPGDDRHVLARLQDALVAEGIPTIDVTVPFQELAARDLSRGEFIYWLDDTHWSRDGIQLAADLTRRAWFNGNQDAQVRQ